MIRILFVFLVCLSTVSYAVDLKKILDPLNVTKEIEKLTKGKSSIAPPLPPVVPPPPPLVPVVAPVITPAPPVPISPVPVPVSVRPVPVIVPVRDDYRDRYRDDDDYDRRSDYGRRPHRYPRPDRYVGVYVDITPDYYSEIRYGISSRVGDSERFTLLLDHIERRARYDQYFSSLQIRDMLSYFGPEYALEFALYAYKSCRDPQNYYRVVDALSSARDRRVLQDYMRREGPILASEPPSERGRFSSDRDCRDLGVEMRVISNGEFLDFMRGITYVRSSRVRLDQTLEFMDRLDMRRQALTVSQLQELVRLQRLPSGMYEVAKKGYYLLIFPEDFESVLPLISSPQYRQRLRLFSDR